MDELKPPPMSDERIVDIAEEHGLGVNIPDAGYKTNMLWFHGDKTDFALAVIAARDAQWLSLVGELQRDAERYRWLRMQHWHDSGMFVVAGSQSCVRLGTVCPSEELLDAAIDAARGEKGGV